MIFIQYIFILFIDIHGQSTANNYSLGSGKCPPKCLKGSGIIGFVAQFHRKWFSTFFTIHSIFQGMMGLCLKRRKLPQKVYRRSARSTVTKCICFFFQVGEVTATRKMVSGWKDDVISFCNRKTEQALISWCLSEEFSWNDRAYMKLGRLMKVMIDWPRSYDSTKKRVQYGAVMWLT